MNKQNLYIALFNALLGVVVSLLLQGNLLIYALACLLLITLLVIERKWIFENIFGKKKWAARLGYSILFAGVLSFFMLLTQSNREVNLAVETLQSFLERIKHEKYDSAYTLISRDSQSEYTLTSFITDHSSIKIKDYRIDEASLNEFNKDKAIIKVSSPFLIYGEKSQDMELVKEEEQWKIVLSPRIIPRSPSLAESSPESLQTKSQPVLSTKASSPKNNPPPKEKKKGGAVTNFFKKIF